MSVLGTTALVHAAVTVLAGAADVSSDDLRIGYDSPMDSMNPIIAEASSAHAAGHMSYEYLLESSPEDLSPDTEHSLAESFEISDDGLTWTFTLNDDIEWSDGTPFSSADVKWTMEHILQTQRSPWGINLAGTTDVRTPDAHTVVVEMAEANPNVPYIPIMPAHVWSELTDEQIDNGDIPLPTVSTGPFVITEYDPRGTTILEANPNYRFGVPEAERVLWVKYGDASGMLRDLRLGELDIVSEGKLDWVRKVEDQATIEAWPMDIPNITTIAFNSCPADGAGTCERPGHDVNLPVVQDPAIRQAVSLAIDRRQIIDTAFSGQATPGLTGIIPPFYVDYAPEPEGSDRAELDAARKVLADGGWDCAENPCVKDGVEASFKLLHDPADPEAVALVQRVRSQLAAVGIDVTMDPQSADAQTGSIYAPGDEEGTFRPTYDAVVSIWTGLSVSPDILMSLPVTGGPFPEVYYSNTAYDRLFQQASATLDLNERVDLFRQANEIVTRDLPYVVIANKRAVWLTRNDTWHGYEPAVNGAPIGLGPRQVASLVPGPDPGSENAEGAGDSASSGGDGGVIAGIALAAVAGVAVLLVRRQRRRPEPEADWIEV